MLEYVLLVSNLCLFVFLFVIYRALRFDPSEILTSLQKSNAGVASGTARQKKKADELIGLSMLESFPAVKVIATRFPELGKYIQTNPGMVPYVAQVFSSIIGGVGSKLPAELQPLIEGFLGQTQQTRKPTRSTETGFR